MEKKVFASHEVIFRQGEDGNSFFQILSGSVEVILDYGTPDALRLAVLGKDQYLGEMAVIENYSRSATAEAGPDGVEVLEVASSELEDYLKGNPGCYLALMKHLGSRLKDLTENYEEVSGLIKAYDLGHQGGASFPEKLKKHARKSRTGLRSVDQLVNDKLLMEKYGEHSKGFAKKVESYPAGTVICKESMVGNCMYDIHWGRVGIFRGYGTEQEMQLTELFPNTFFGEMGLISGAPRTATAVALDDTTLELIFEEDLEEIFEKNPPKAIMVLAHLSHRIRQLTGQYEDACELASGLLDALGSKHPVSAELAGRIRKYTGQ